jgi:hypothetical protein
MAGDIYEKQHDAKVRILVAKKWSPFIYAGNGD